MRTLLFIVCLLLPTAASAATISFDPQDSQVGTDGSFTVGIDASADDQVNTFDLKIGVPSFLTPVDVSDGNSVIVLWVDAPHFDAETHTLSFSGIVPNGFSGKDGRLLTVTFTAQSGTHQLGAFRLLPGSLAYMGEGIAVPLTAPPLQLPFVRGKTNIKNPLPDEDAPVAFVPTIVRDTSLAGGKRTLIFSTTDKESGIDHYEVRESWLPFATKQFGWHTATSPYVLADQWGVRTIFVRAVDKSGNAYTVAVPPERNALVVVVLPLYVLLAVLVYGYVKWSTKRVSSRARSL